METFVWVIILAALVLLYLKFKKRPKAATTKTTTKIKLPDLPSSDFRDAAAYTGLFVTPVPDWLVDAVQPLIGSNQPLSKELTAIQNSGEPLSADEKKALGIPARAKIGQRYVECLSDAGRAQPFSALGIAAMTAHLNKGRADNLQATFIDTGLDPSGAQLSIVAAQDDRTCEAAKRIDGKRYPLSEAPALPLKECDSITACNSHCRCLYNVHFE